MDQIHARIQTPTFETSKVMCHPHQEHALTIAIDEHERRNILQWLKPAGIDAHEFHRQKRALREEGTCDWLAESKAFQDWYQGGSDKHARFLWIHGLPGAGKTVLASFGIDHVASAYHHMGVSYYYCSHERQRKGHSSSEEATSFLRWVIRDLTAQVTRPKARSLNRQAKIPKTLQDLYTKRDFALMELLDCLLVVTEYTATEFSQQVCIIVDAVDESPAPRDQLLNVLTTIGTDPKWQHVSLCFTSRKETDITLAIESIHNPREIRTPVGPSKKLVRRNNKTRSGFDGSGFDGGSSARYNMGPPQGGAFERGRVPLGSAPEFSTVPQRYSRSESRRPSGEMLPHQSGRERSISMSPAGEADDSDPMEIDTPSRAVARSRNKKGCTILSMDNPDVIFAIRTFVQNQLQDHPIFRRWKQDQLDEVIDQLARKAKGM